MISKIIFTVVFLQTIQLVVGAPHSDNFCNFEIDSKSSPLISNKAGSFIPTRKTDGKNFVEIPHGEYFTASCPTTANWTGSFVNLDKDILNLECVSGSLVKSDAGFTNFTDLKCSPFAGETVLRTGTCEEASTMVEISFNGAGTDPQTALIYLCHNEAFDDTLYAKSFIYGAKLDDMEAVGTSPDFRKSDFYSSISPDTCYTQAKQIETLGILVGSTSLAAQYIQVDKSLYLARGHLIPAGDPILKVEKHATYYFINASPQWQIINNGNWKKLETAVRTIAGNQNSTLNVWTGNYQVLSLDDVNGNPVEIWLGRNSQGGTLKKLPVPKYIWKVVHNESAKQAVAVIQINNPHASVKAADIFCPDRCSDLPWVTWDTKDVQVGYTFCCDVAAFEKAVPFAPSLGNLTILK